MFFEKLSAISVEHSWQIGDACATFQGTTGNRSVIGGQLQIPLASGRARLPVGAAVFLDNYTFGTTTFHGGLQPPNLDISEPHVELSSSSRNFGRTKSAVTTQHCRGDHGALSRVRFVSHVDPSRESVTAPEVLCGRMPKAESCGFRNVTQAENVSSAFRRSRRAAGLAVEPPVTEKAERLLARDFVDAPMKRLPRRGGNRAWNSADNTNSREKLRHVKGAIMTNQTESNSVPSRLLNGARQLLLITLCGLMPVLSVDAQTRYRITLNGFEVHHETADHILEADGKRDEIVLRCEVWVVSLPPTGTSGSPRLISHVRKATPTMGDRGNENNVIQAGSAPPNGGLRTGDKYPAKEPWRRGQETFPDRVPMLLWEGNLLNTGVMLMPTVWENDHDSTEILERWFEYVSRIQADQFRRDNEIVSFDGSGGGIRPVGLTPVFRRFVPRMISIDTATAERIISAEGGIIAIRYREPVSDVLDGDYTLYLQIERLPQ